MLNLVWGAISIQNYLHNAKIKGWSSKTISFETILNVNGVTYFLLKSGS